MRNEDFAVHVRRRRFVSKIICEGLVGGSCNGNQFIFIQFNTWWLHGAHQLGETKTILFKMRVVFNSY